MNPIAVIEKMLLLAHYQQYVIRTRIQPTGRKLPEDVVRKACGQADELVVRFSKEYDPDSHGTVDHQVQQVVDHLRANDYELTDDDLSGLALLIRDGKITVNL